MQPPREIELKLECDVQDLAALSGHPLLQAKDGASPVVLQATYFDTAKRDLRDAGLSLRLRREDGRIVQTLKSGAAAAGLFDRPEWEWEVAGQSPEPSLLEGTPAAAILARADAPELEPLFSTVVERTTRGLRHGESEIAATLDAGRIEAAQGDQPICEVELELKAGQPADLFSLARALGETVPLRLGAMSKGERGYALIDGTLHAPSKAPKTAFDDDATAGDAFVRISQTCLRHLRLNEAVFLHARSAEALHQMRVALRRLRSAFTLYKPMLAQDATAQALRAEIKRVTEPFGTARNLDVYLSETLAAEIERRPDEPGLHDLRTRLEAERDEAYAAVLATLNSPAWRGLLIDLLTWVEAGSWRTGPASPHRDRLARDFATDVLQRLRRRLRKRGRHLARLGAEDRHRVRIEAKKLRYGAEFFGPLFTGTKAHKRHKTFVGALSDLQDHLGSLNDLATAHDIATRLAADAGSAPASGAALFAAGLTTADAQARAGRLLEEADDALVTLLDVKPFWR